MSFSMSGLKVSGEKVEHISLALKAASLITVSVTPTKVFVIYYNNIILCK